MSVPLSVKATTSTYRMYVQTKKSLLNVNNTFNKVTLDHSPTTFRFNLYTILNFHKNRCLVLLSFNRVSLEEKKQYNVGTSPDMLKHHDQPRAKRGRGDGT